MQIHLNFSLEEKIEFLERRGYTVALEVIQMSYHGYHDDVEYRDLEVYSVRDVLGKPFCEPGGYHYYRMDWLDAALCRETAQALKELLLP